MKTSESRWLPPCMKCGEESKRWCYECAIPYCEADYDLCHTGADCPEHMRIHTWSATDGAKEILSAGQVYCIECKNKIGNLMCMNCMDAFCDDCYKYIHHTGTLSTHTYIPYKRAKKGWLCIKASMTGSEQDYYINGTTGETTYTKPIELMTNEEKIYYNNFIIHQQSAEQNVKVIEKLQLELEMVKYERDTVLYDALSSSTNNKNNINKNNIMASLGIRTTTGSGTGAGTDLTSTSASSPTHANNILNTLTNKNKISGTGTGFLNMLKSGGKSVISDVAYRERLLTPSTNRSRSKSKSDYIESLLNDTA